METKWHIGREAVSDPITIREGGRWGNLLAEIRPAPGDTGVARLMGHSPELLASLEKMAAWAKHLPYTGDYDDVCLRQDLQEAQELIKKAKP